METDALQILIAMWEDATQLDYVKGLIEVSFAQVV